MSEIATEPPSIYTSWTGKEVVRFSYSMATAIDQCGHRTRLERIDGYEAKEIRASRHFGQAVEGAIRSWIQSGGTRVIEDSFSEIWKSWKEAALVYKDQEQGWGYMESMGRRLCGRFRNAYEAGELPQMDAKDHFNEELFLPDWHKGTGIVYIADMVRPRSLLLDIKTTEKNRPKNFGEFVALDRQLRVGSLVTGIRTVGFLVGSWGNAGGWKHYPGTVTDELLADVDLWLKAQYGKYERREFHRSAGILFPNQVCTSCDMMEACLKGDYSNLHRRESAAAMDDLEKIDDE